MRTPRVIATKCRLCGEPIIEDSPDEAWILLAEKWAAHLACANEATKDRLFKEEEAAG